MTSACFFGRRLAVAASALAISLAVPVVASAQTPDGAHDLSSPIRPCAHDSAEFALDATLVTALPIVVGGALALEVPEHVVVRVSAGAVPNAYVDAVGDIGTDLGAWNVGDANDATTLLAGATFLEFGLGIRPAGTPGIELYVGYAMLWSHRLAGMGLIGGSGEGVLGLDLNIDAVHAEIAWQTELLDHVYFRLALGWAHAFAHRVSLSTAAPDEATRASLARAQASLSETVGRSAFGPTLGAALGVRY